jgi:two-component system response regulator HydG
MDPGIDRELNAADSEALDTPEGVQSGTVLVLDDEEQMLRSLERMLAREGYRVLTGRSGREGLEVLRATHGDVDVALCDLRMGEMSGVEFVPVARSLYPDLEVVIMTGYGTIETAVAAMRAGAYDFVPKPFKRVQILRVLSRAMERRQLLLENRRLRAQVAEGTGKTIVGNSTVMRRLLEMVSQVAPSEATVLILGESGTGKELIARAVHAGSDRSRKPFVKVSCAALPETLLEGELFGYEKGAFTGAVRRKPGRFELAEGGTLFLDEIGDVPLEMQVKLLRVLQEREYERLGGTETLRADVRVIAATHRDLRQRAAEGLFREDLYYRLAVIPLEIAPLRDRREDIPLLAASFAEKLSQKNHSPVPSLHPEVMERLLGYHWPGNVRELENVIERAVVLCKDRVIRASDLPDEINPTRLHSNTLQVPLGTTLREIEDTVIEQTLRITNGSKEKTAHLLGVAARTIYRHIKAVQDGGATQGAGPPPSEPRSDGRPHDGREPNAQPDGHPPLAPGSRGDGPRTR